MKLIFTILNFTFVLNMFGRLPDLTVSSGSFEPSTISAGEMLTIHATVQNSGPVQAGSCRLAFYISQSSAVTDGYLLGSVSVTPLNAGNTSENIEFIIFVPHFLTPGSYYIGWKVDSYNEVPESDENNGFYLPSAQLTITPGLVFDQHIPYPIVFIHGWISDNTTWDSLAKFLERFGWKNGGRMDFCLNVDGDLSTGLFANDYYDFTNEINLQLGDFYFINFDVRPNGSIHNNTVESNQSAIVKQGVAVHNAIRHVLNVSNRDKVILVGHSMGGLAAREYLQNTPKWQNDGLHHVAKLVTIGTPHGGSNQSTFGIVGDGYSEAIRDLRTSYSNGANGVYLFGGNENNINTIGFHNIDVDCNGFIGDSIIGLNQKNTSTNLAYSCIIGNRGGSGDGIVDIDKANLNNYYFLNADTFLVDAWHSETLANLFGGNFETGSIETELRGLDEPTYFNQSYGINFDSLYFGLITSQSKGNLLFPDTTDYDDYEFHVNRYGMAHITVRDIAISSFKVEIFDSLYNSIISKLSHNLSQIDTSVLLLPGKYYLEISGLADAYSWYSPYVFKVTFTQSTPVVDNTNVIPNQYNLFQNYPNPFNPTTTISFEIPEERFVTLKIYDVLGREVKSLVNEKKPVGKYSYTLDCSSWPSGIYYYRIQTGSFEQTKKLALLK